MEVLLCELMNEDVIVPSYLLLSLITLEQQKQCMFFFSLLQNQACYMSVYVFVVFNMQWLSVMTWLQPAKNTALLLLGTVDYTYEPSPLPEGWVTLQHCSGGTIYFHKASRTCTWARPYTVGTSYTVRVRCQVLFVILFLLQRDSHKLCICVQQHV